ncbi:hypothetical protein [Mucilaginibacter auburnensis]|uniref:Uncharacterized protein n=1 Tax=Mucilaginibacter auburnensis TaxID=1457233 RepID=A0A2H9VNR2_9SPHI|nr:hypothetical protein [Mucilaginibacter auburnensis]PJJ79988.1 hypothetical protein CLV57_3130 [Mucilaginibacter auburnensis]
MGHLYPFTCYITKLVITLLCVAVIMVVQIRTSSAQSKLRSNADSVVSEIALKNINVSKITQDTNVKSVLIKKPAQVKALASKNANKFKDVFAQNLGSLKNNTPSFNLTIESSNRYQPLQIMPGILPGNNSNQKFVSVITVIGNLNAWGIPLNLNFSTNQNLNRGPSSLINNLFKFNFDPKQFSNLYRSEFNQYYQLSSRVFGGLDLSGYTSQKLLDQLTTGKGVLPAGITTNLSEYLGDSNNMAELLNMDENAVRKKLLTKAMQDSAVQSKMQTPEQIMALKKETVENTLAKQNALHKLSNISALKQKLSEDKYINSLDNMSKDDVAYKLSQLVTNENLVAKLVPSTDVSDVLLKLCGLNADVKSYVNNEIVKQNANNSAAIEQLAENIVERQKTGVTTTDLYKVPQIKNVDDDLNKKGQDILSETSAHNALKDSIAVVKHIDSLVTSLSEIKKQLHANGFDVKSLLQTQNLLKLNGNSLGNSEIAQRLLAKKPGNPVQNIFSRVEALQIGSFSNKLTESQPRDMFINGANLTVKTGNIPVTIGYGRVNDIGSFKDADFQSSIYGASQNLTYISAEFKRNKADNVKILMVSGASTNTTSTTLYTTPAVSSNTIAFTLSKDINLQKAGKFTVDFSKSTTQYPTVNTLTTETILDRKSGNTLNTNGNLFEALAFGFNHHLDLKEIGLSDNFYVNYSGMGYQNPANIGLSGGRFRMGGNVKKSLYKNKLILNLKTDLKTMPISYSADDKWKSLQVQLDTRFVVNKKFNLNLRYVNNGTSKNIDNTSTPVYTLNKMQVDGNLTYKIGRNYTVSHFSIGSQIFSNPTDKMATTANKTLLFNYTQSLILHNNTLTASLLYNKELSPNKMIGNLLNTDVIYQYTLFRKLNVSSGITYLENDNIARQIGIKQTMQLYTSGNFDIDTYLDIRKNLITPQYADLYASCRAEVILRYHLNKK